MMKILFVLENYYPNIGGVETLFKSVTEKLVHNNIEVTVVTNRFSKELKKEEVIDGVKIVRLPFKNRYLFTFFSVFPILKYAKAHDIIHTTSYNAGLPAFLAGLLTRKRTVITFHEVWGKLWFTLPYMGKFSLKLHYLFEQFLLKLGFYKFIAVSHATSLSLQNAGIDSKRIEVILNGIEYEEFKDYKKKEQSDETFNFIYFGRLGVSKGLDIILEAAKLLSQETNAFALTLVIPKTPKDFHSRIRSYISDNKLNAYIEIKSELPREQLFQNVKNADAVLIPSYSEGFCYSAAETMALGTPIISSGRGALREVVNGKHLTLEKLDGLSLKTLMVKAMRNEWDHTPEKKYHLADTVNAYIEFYKGILEV